jgi:hypothetical protein
MGMGMGFSVTENGVPFQIEWPFLQVVDQTMGSFLANGHLGNVFERQMVEESAKKHERPPPQ